MAAISNSYNVFANFIVAILSGLKLDGVPKPPNGLASVLLSVGLCLDGTLTCQFEWLHVLVGKLLSDFEVDGPKTPNGLASDLAPSTMEHIPAVHPPIFLSRKTLHPTLNSTSFLG